MNFPLAVRTSHRGSNVLDTQFDGTATTGTGNFKFGIFQRERHGITPFRGGLNVTPPFSGEYSKGDKTVTIDIDELREAESLLARMAAHAEKILPVLELMKSAGGQSILPQPVDRLIQRGEVMEMLKIGTAAVNQLIKAGKLTPLYVADSGNQKFRLSEVERVVSTIPPKPKVCNLRRHSA